MILVYIIYIYIHCANDQEFQHGDMSGKNQANIRVQPLGVHGTSWNSHGIPAGNYPLVMSK